ncbi:MAG: hypothetical protein J4N97_02155 [Chloroflexi bacterium]|nr:hypothetical protein [Chloroflexota bacterium]
MLESRVAEDRFEQYYTEKLWEWIPYTYRLEDGEIGDRFSRERRLSNTGSVSTNPGVTELDDTGQDFFSGPADVSSMMLEVTFTDNSGATALAYSGARDIDGDGTRIELFRDARRQVAGVVPGGGFNSLNTPLLYIARPVNSGPLRQMVELVAQQAATLRRSHDRLWQDQVIERADDWAVPYIADLVGTRLISALNKAGRRADVANTIYYRRRKGTLAVLEQLIADIARWDGKIVESFRRLGRTHHGLDPEPARGRMSGTMMGGWADLRNPGAANLAHGPFDEFHHSPDLRQHRGQNGRYGIQRLAFHLYRLKSYPLRAVTPRLVNGTVGFTFDPSGRNVPLFSRGDRVADWDQWKTAEEWELPVPVSRRLLLHAEFIVTERTVRLLESDPGLSAAEAADLRGIRRVRFRSEERLLETVLALPSTAGPAAPPYFDRLLSLSITEDSAQANLLPADSTDTRNRSIVVDEDGTGVVPRHRVFAAHLTPWSSTAHGKRIAVEPERGRLLFLEPPSEPISVSYYHGLSGEVGAGGYERQECLVPVNRVRTEITGGGATLNPDAIHNDGVTQINDSATYEPVSDKLAVRNLTLQAANGHRPYLLPGVNWVLNAAEFSDSTVTLDGLWIGGTGGEVILRAERHVEGVLQHGSYERVTIRHCTLDPGGETADCNPIQPVPLLIDCRVKELVILNSIMGPILTTDRGYVEKLSICDSIVQSLDPAVPAISLGQGELKLDRDTVFGDVQAHRLRASEALIEGKVNVSDVQSGCFRFSAASADSVLPHPYRSVELTGERHIFTSRRFGDPGYGQLSDSAPESLKRGAENTSEIGVFSNLINPIKLDGLTAKAREFMPFGLIPMMINET